MKYTPSFRNSVLVFNFFIGNTDNHIKNYSLLYNKDLRTVRLAPCYDVVATRVYKNDINEMSLSINEKLNMDDVTRADFELEAKSCGLGTKPAMKIFDEVQNGLLEALKESAGELEEKGFIQAGEIADKIKRRGVIHHDNRNKQTFLREYKFDDYDALYEIVSDAETMQHYPAPFDEEKTRGWIKWNLENYEKYGFGLWAVVLKETGEFIGDCGITIQNIDGELLPEIGYHIHKKYWRRGFAKEAARAVRDWVFTNTDYNEIYSYMKYTNVASYSTAIAMGMRKVKEYLDPKNYVSYAYSIKRADWENIIAGQKT